MADFNVRLQPTVSPKVVQRTLLLGRVKMAQAIQMPESEWAKLLADIEKDPLFQELLSASASGQRLVRFKRFGRTEIAGQFYEEQDANVMGGGGGVSPETLLEKKKYVLDIIQKVGRENFEKYFLYREEGEPSEEIAKKCGVTFDEVKKLQDFILDVSVQAEFYYPSTLESPQLAKPTLIGKIVKNADGTFSFSFYSPHLARGMYEINREALKRWQKSRGLSRSEAAKLKRYVGVLELSNMKQGAFWRTIDYMLQIQKDYFQTQDVSKMSPVSLRDVAAHLQFAPSTISRVLSNKSVLLPWDKEVMLLHLMPGQRKVVLRLMEKILSQAKDGMTDLKLSQKIAEISGINVSRRTVTACRHVLNSENPPGKN